MLRYLSIKRLAVIDAVEVEFGPGLNVLTGETGAGKSILVGAVGLLVGGRATGDLVRTGEEAAAVEAIFEVAGEEVLIRREISAQGRSRAFINGDLVTAGALRDRSADLIELHGQHEHHTLLDPATHLAVLDSFGSLDQLAAAVAAAFAEMRSVADDLEQVTRATADRETRQEFVAFQLNEISRAAPVPDEDEQLRTTRQVLASAERVQQLCAESYAALYESDDAILGRLGAVWRRVTELAALDPQFQPYLEARESIKSQLEDLAAFLRRYADQIEASPTRLQEIEERLALLERLKRKYGPALRDVVARRDQLQRESNELERSDERKIELEQRYERARARYVEAARTLSDARHRVADDFAVRLEHLLAELAMEHTRFEVRFDDQLPESAWTASGIDAAEFFVCPNPGEELRPLARIASGGELSRIMLGIKTLTAASRRGFSQADERPPGGAPPGMVFDEVDAGIGGRAATVVGRKLHALGSAFQVLCITHLPQIAACADLHYAIHKRVIAGRTHTEVARLDDTARVEELARMLGGESITDGLRASAREMIVGRRASIPGSGMAADHGDRSANQSRKAKAKGRKAKA